MASMTWNNTHITVEDRYEKKESIKLRLHKKREI
jgi:hypothetical protein